MTLAVIDRMYELYERLGEGGMGTVYRATHRLSGRTVALKLIRGTLVESGAEAAPAAGLRSGPDTYSRLALAREFQVMASLHHPHIVKVLDFGFDERHGPYLAMELLPAPRTLLEAGADASHETRLDWLAQLLRALVYLHRRGVIHRDIKPSDVPGGSFRR